MCLLFIIFIYYCPVIIVFYSIWIVLFNVYVYCCALFTEQNSTELPVNTCDCDSDIVGPKQYWTSDSIQLIGSLGSEIHKHTCGGRSPPTTRRRSSDGRMSVEEHPRLADGHYLLLSRLPCVRLDQLTHSCRVQLSSRRRFLHVPNVLMWRILAFLLN